MDVVSLIKEKARRQRRRVALPEATDERVLRAAAAAAEQGLADPVLIGAEAEVRRHARRADVSLTGVEIIEPSSHPRLRELVQTLAALRKHKGMTETEAATRALDPVTFSALLVRSGEADGYVAGAVHSTADTFRPALQIVKPASGVTLVSAYFIMVLPDKGIGADGVLLYADAGLVPDPDAEELAEIALAAAHTAQTLLEMEPRVAMLSFSTRGSAGHPMAQKVVAATQIVRTQAPDLLVDGELQVDAAIVPEEAAPEGGMLFGVVRDLHDRPLADVEVGLDPGGRSAMTDPHGRFAFRGLAPGRYGVIAKREGFAMVTFEPDPVQVILGPPAGVEVFMRGPRDEG